MTLSEDDFNQQCREFVSKCREFADEDWFLLEKSADGRVGKVERNRGPPGAAKVMLAKEEKRRTRQADAICSFEYNVIYSESYEVPVMYFCASDQNGAHVPPEAILMTEQRDLSNIVNQVEHPLLFRPFYMVHPCRTRAFMEPHRKLAGRCYLIIWLSMVAALLGLRLDERFGLLDLAKTDGQAGD